MAAGTALSAVNAKIRIGSTVFYGAKWTVTPETEWLDTTNFEGNRFETQIAGVRRCEVTFEGFWDSGQNPHDSPPNIVDGQDLSSVKLYVSGTTGPFWSFPTLSVKSVPVNAEVKGLVQISVNGKANGTYVYPTGNV